MKNAMSILDKLFHNVDIDNQEVTEPLIAEYNLTVRSLLVEIQTDYGFRLHCCDMEYDDVAVWTDLLKILVRRSSTPLVQQTNHNVNPQPQFSFPTHPNNSFLDRSSTPDREAWKEVNTGWRRWPTSGIGWVNTTMHHWEADQ